jgi:hypothetical protein
MSCFVGFFHAQNTIGRITSDYFPSSRGLEFAEMWEKEGFLWNYLRPTVGDRVKNKQNRLKGRMDELFPGSELFGMRVIRRKSNSTLA